MRAQEAQGAQQQQQQQQAGPLPAARTTMDFHRALSTMLSSLMPSKGCEAARPNMEPSPLEKFTAFSSSVRLARSCTTPKQRLEPRARPQRLKIIEGRLQGESRRAE